MPRKKNDSPATAVSSTVPTTPRRRASRTRAAASVNGTSHTAPPLSYDQIAEAAYLRYINRGGGDGADFDDWVEAERELAQRA